MRHLIAVVLLTVSAGCESHRVAMEDREQPWVGPAERAVAFARCRYGVETVDRWLTWENTTGKVYDSRRIIKDSMDYLESVGQTPAKTRITRAQEPKDTVWPWYDPLLGNAETLPAATETLTIVCLDPIVVLISGGDVPYIEGYYVWKVQPYRANNGSGIKGDIVLLPYGFLYGTSVPDKGAMSWFSPSMCLGPIEPEWISESRGVIPVPWGSLEVTRLGNDWQVDASR
jgi:hypothetical protein